VVEEVNRLIRQAADLTGADTLDLWTGLKDHPEWFPDHLHPNADGARRIAEIVRDQFARLVEPGISFGP
jgi:lysophospholipase L1-like esterase